MKTITVYKNITLVLQRELQDDEWDDLANTKSLLSVGEDFWDEGIAIEDPGCSEIVQVSICDDETDESRSESCWR